MKTIWHELNECLKCSYDLMRLDHRNARIASGFPLRLHQCSTAALCENSKRRWRRRRRGRRALADDADVGSVREKGWKTIPVQWSVPFRLSLRRWSTFIQERSENVVSLASLWCKEQAHMNKRCRFQPNPMHFRDFQRAKVWTLFDHMLKFDLFRPVGAESPRRFAGSGWYCLDHILQRHTKTA